jgi:hypothetical protein
LTGKFGFVSGSEFKLSGAGELGLCLVLLAHVMPFFA